MATSGERRALLFLAAVAVLGAGTRVVRARQTNESPADLGRQIAAVDSAASGSPRPRVGRSARRKQPANPPTREPAVPVDFDRATVAEIMNLPGIGPALARRIVGNRDSLGAFGCLAALDGVKGIGPAMLRRLDSLAVFSGPARAACSGTAAFGLGGKHEGHQEPDENDDHG